MQVAALAFEVDRTALDRTRFVTETVCAADDEIVVRIDEFAHTANNLTYARLGDAAGYWTSFPTVDLAWGRIPAWGNATVLASRHREIAVGERFYGFVPMASHVVMRPDRVRVGGFVDAADARAGLSPVYASYRRLGGNDEIVDALRPVFEPVFFLAFVLDAAIADEHREGPIVMTSASSKAAIATAHLLRRRGIETTALTSRRNTPFCTGLGCFAEVYAYDESPYLETGPVTVVDFSGDTDLVETITSRVGAVGCIRAGLTHGVPGGGLSTLFSAPHHIIERTRKWGREEFQRRFDESLVTFLAWSDSWIDLIRTTTPDELRAHHLDTINGRTRPATAALHHLGD